MARRGRPRRSWVVRALLLHLAHAHGPTEMLRERPLQRAQRVLVEVGAADRVGARTRSAAEVRKAAGAAAPAQRARIAQRSEDLAVAVDAGDRARAGGAGGGLAAG